MLENIQCMPRWGRVFPQLFFYKRKFKVNQKQKQLTKQKNADDNWNNNGCNVNVVIIVGSTLGGRSRFIAINRRPPIVTVTEERAGNDNTVTVVTVVHRAVRNWFTDAANRTNVVRWIITSDIVNKSSSSHHHHIDHL